MRNPRLGIVAALALLLAGMLPALASAQATEAEAAHTYTVRGEIERLPDSGDSFAPVVIRHDDIPEFVDRDGRRVGMRPMAVAFTPAPGLYLGQFTTGQDVHFTFNVDWGEPPLLTVTEIAPLLPHLEDAERLPVVRVVDGDTIVVDRDGAQETIRLIGVDTPETKDPRKEVQFYGQEAAAFLENLLKREEVYILTEGARTKDHYGRTLAHVYRAPDGLWVNLEIVRQGYGQVYTAEAFNAIKLFLASQRKAREAGKGLWNPDLKADWDRERATPAQPPARPAAPRPVEKPAEEVKPVPQSVTVYVTRTGAKYHRGSCSYLRQSKIAISLDDAKRRYGACSRCSPPR
jgi:micrococcal nuclease